MNLEINISLQIVPQQLFSIWIAWKYLYGVECLRYHRQRSPLILNYVYRHDREYFAFGNWMVRSAKE